jgi:hypothetical protein
MRLILVAETVLHLRGPLGIAGKAERFSCLYVVMIVMIVVAEAHCS